MNVIFNLEPIILKKMVTWDPDIEWNKIITKAIWRISYSPKHIVRQTDQTLITLDIEPTVLEDPKYTFFIKDYIKL